MNKASTKTERWKVGGSFCARVARTLPGLLCGIFDNTRAFNVLREKDKNKLSFQWRERRCDAPKQQQTESLIQFIYLSHSLQSQAEVYRRETERKRRRKSNFVVGRAS